MRVVVQRVTSASVSIDDTVYNKIRQGLLLLVGIEELDTVEDLVWLAAKIVNMRIFSDDNGLMNKSVADVFGEILVISQFTLFASTKKGNRPSFIRAAKPEYATKLYEMFCAQLSQELSRPVKTGVFGADMQIALMNDGPVTILIDSKNRE
ncbi:MAG TPA: D-aminoacyl-tRNA deacylase [Flavobacteriales bacterium]|jgi:D-tyrosyl-tRNA(Tyr) deacylase|nr:D-aminoacyl-tRNA deacylase [Flavobacteriales bacterium]HPH83310.1 D-aminoacyl-tRNA deacylase [Flavobacteriales bacterium]